MAVSQVRQAFFASLNKMFDESGMSRLEIADRSRIPLGRMEGFSQGKMTPGRLTLHRLIEACGPDVLLTKRLIDLWQEFPHPSREGTATADVAVHGGTVNISGDLGRDMVVHGGTVNLDSGVSRRLYTGGPPLLVPDEDGAECKPDPSTARTEQEFVAVMRAFRGWAGGYSTRKLASWSKGAFSHTTIAAVLNGKARATLGYVQGFIRACGADEAEVRRWSTAYRRVYEGLAPAGVNEEGSGKTVSMRDWAKKNA